MSAGYLVDAKARTVTEVSFETLDDLQKLVGGSIEAAFLWPSGDVLYVDEEGLLKSPEHFFRLLPERRDQPFASNGVLVGREEEGDQYPGGYTNHPPAMTIEELRQHIRFLA